MTDYVKSTNFTSKDSLASGNPLKIIKGTEFDVEFNNIAVAVTTKADIISPAFTGVPTAPTAGSGTTTSQLATTAFAQAAIVTERTTTATLTNKTLTSPVINGGTISGITDLAIIDGGTAASTALDGFNNLKQNATDVYTGVVELATTTEAATGTDTTRAVTAAGVEAHMNANELGWGQTWQTPIRTHSIDYQNTTGRPIQVCSSTRGAGGVFWQISSDGSTWYDTTYATSGGGYHGTTLIIPNTHYYRINGAATIDVWLELR